MRNLIIIILFFSSITSCKKQNQFNSQFEGYWYEIDTDYTYMGDTLFFSSTTFESKSFLNSIFTATQDTLTITIEDKFKINFEYYFSNDKNIMYLVCYSGLLTECTDASFKKFIP